MTAVRSDPDTQSGPGGEQPDAKPDAAARKPWLYRLVPLAWIGVLVGLFFVLGGPGLFDGDDGPEALPLLADEKPGVPAPIFTKFEADPVGKNAWDVTLTLVDKKLGTPLPPVTVTVTGTAPDGAAFGPVEFTDQGKGIFTGRVTGAAGKWALVAEALSSSDAEVAPTQQSFAPVLPEGTAKSQPKSQAKSTS